MRIRKKKCTNTQHPRLRPTLPAKTKSRLLDRFSTETTYRSSSILLDFDPVLGTCLLRDVPFGRGGLDEPRNAPISIEEYIRLCLRLSSRRHVRHPSFALVAFDVLARHRAMLAVYLTTRLTPSRVASAGTVTRDVLLSRVACQEERLRAFQQNRAP